MSELLPILDSISPGTDFSQSQNFIDDGLLDSFDVVTLVAALEKKLNISIDGADVTPENFKNLETLEAFVRRYRENNGL